MRAAEFVIVALGALAELGTLLLVSQADPAGPISIGGRDRVLIAALGTGSGLAIVAGLWLAFRRGR